MHPYFFDLPDQRADELAPRLRVRGLPHSEISREVKEFAATAQTEHPPPAPKRKGGFVVRLFRRRQSLATA